MPRVTRTLVVGGDRPLGAAFVRAALARGHRVLVTARQPGRVPLLADLAAEHGDRLATVAMRPVDEDSIASAAAAVAGLVPALDLLVNAAWVDAAAEDLGATERVGSLRAATPGDLTGIYLLDAVGPILVARGFRPLLRAGTSPRLLNVTSWLGSIAGRRDGGHYGAGMAGAALAMATRLLAFDLEVDGILVLGGDPGLYKVHLHGPAGQLSADAAASGLLDAALAAGEPQRGRVLNWKGETCEW